MPSKLPIIKANTKQENIDKMKYIAEQNKRSLAKELELIIEQHIRKYEHEFGEIIIDNSENQDSPAMKVVKTVTGVYAGEALADAFLDVTGLANKSKNK